MSEEKIQEWGWDEFEESMQPETGSGFVKKQDHLRILQSEHQASLEAETKLRELQDILGQHATPSQNGYTVEFNAGVGSIPYEHIQESRTRRQNDDTTI